MNIILILIIAILGLQSIGAYIYFLYLIRQEKERTNELIYALAEIDILYIRPFTTNNENWFYANEHIKDFITSKTYWKAVKDKLIEDENEKMKEIDETISALYLKEDK